MQRHERATTNAAEAGETRAAGVRRGRWQKARIFSMRLLLFLLFVASFCCSIVPWGRALARAVLILPALVTLSIPRPLLFFGETVQHTQMTLSSRSGTAYLDIFAPDAPVPQFGSVRGGVLVISGVGDNRRVPQLVNFLESLARTNLVVVHIATPQLLKYVLSVQDEDAIVKAFQVQQHMPGMQGKRIAMVAFSAGMSALYFAAGDERIRDQVASVTTLGGYFNLSKLMRDIGRRAIAVDGRSRPWHPIDTTVRVLATMMARHLPPEDGELLKRAFDDHHPIPLSAQEAARLSLASQAAYRILKGETPEQVDANIAALPTSLRAKLDELSIKHALGDVRAPIFLLHDSSDPNIPFTESRAFDAALTARNHPHRYVEFHIFNHVEIRSGLDLSELLSGGTQLLIVLIDVLYTTS